MWNRADPITRACPPDRARSPIWSMRIAGVSNTATDRRSLPTSSRSAWRTSQCFPAGISDRECLAAMSLDPFEHRTEHRRQPHRNGIRHRDQDERIRNWDDCRRADVRLIARFIYLPNASWPGASLRRDPYRTRRSTRQLGGSGRPRRRSRHHPNMPLPKASR